MAQQPLSPDEIHTPNTSPTRDRNVDVRNGLNVYSQDGQLLGQVDEFIIDASGNLTSFIVRTGTPTQQELRLLMDWIHCCSREQIQLRITAAEALVVGLENTARPRHISLAQPDRTDMPA